MSIQLNNLQRALVFAAVAGIAFVQPAFAGHGFGGKAFMAKSFASMPVRRTKAENFIAKNLAPAQPAKDNIKGLDKSKLVDTPSAHKIIKGLDKNKLVDQQPKKVIKGLDKKKIIDAMGSKADPKKKDPTKTPPGTDPTDPGMDKTGKGALLGNLLPLLTSLGQGGDSGSGGGSAGCDTGSGGYDPNAGSSPAPAAEAAPATEAPVQYAAAAAADDEGSVDLVLEDVTLAANATVVAGPAYAVRFRNQGTTASGKFAVAAVASLDGTLRQDAPRVLLEVPALGAGETREMVLRLPAAAMKMGPTASAFSYLIVAVDATGVVNESDKTNNTAVLERAALEVAAN